MPLYEYYCEPCDGVFELLRPAREASQAQPCPECDDDAKRIVSREWSAFMYRDGLPRRLPDTGGYWHLGKRVSKPITGAVEPMKHPELKYAPKVTAPSLEELEQFEYKIQQKEELNRMRGVKTVNQSAAQDERAFRTRLNKTRGTDKTERAKQRLREKELKETRQFLHKMETDS